MTVKSYFDVTNNKEPARVRHCRVARREYAKGGSSLNTVGAIRCGSRV